MEKRFVSHLLSSAFVILALVAAAPAQAQLRSHELRFVPPSDARVVGFHVYVSASSMSYADWRDDVNYVPPVDASGAASFVLTDLEACRSPRTCPHGRPTMIYLSVDLLERQFGRRGAR